MKTGWGVLRLNTALAVAMATATMMATAQTIADLRRVGLISSSEEGSAIQLQVKTILNQVQRFVGFVYQGVRMLGGPERPESIEITVEPHAGIRRRCSRGQKPAPG